jgi:hypothetical protein
MAHVTDNIAKGTRAFRIRQPLAASSFLPFDWQMQNALNHEKLNLLRGTWSMLSKIESRISEPPKLQMQDPLFRTLAMYAWIYR